MMRGVGGAFMPWPCGTRQAAWKRRHRKKPDESGHYQHSRRAGSGPIYRAFSGLLTAFRLACYCLLPADLRRLAAQPDEQHDGGHDQEDAGGCLEKFGASIATQNLVEIPVDSIADHENGNYLAIVSPEWVKRHQQQEEERHADRL